MSAVTDALAGSRAEVFWSDRDDAPDRRPTLQGTIDATSDPERSVFVSLRQLCLVEIDQRRHQRHRLDGVP